MSESDLIEQINALRDKLARAEKRAAALREKSKHLENQYEDARQREANSHDLTMELIERQRELNVMLNRAHIMLNRTQEAMALTSMEFNEMAKALPEPKKVEWADRVARINDLFKKTGVQDAEVLGLTDGSPEATPSLESDELRKEAEQSFSRKETIWQNTDRRDPPRVEAIPVEDATPAAPAAEPADVIADAAPEQEQKPQVDLDQIVSDYETGEEAQSDQEQRRKSWWQRLAG